MVAPQVIRRPYTATLITAKGVIPAKAGIQKNTGFPRIKYPVSSTGQAKASSVKPGMTNLMRLMSLCIKTDLIEILVFVLVIFFLSAGSYWRNQLWSDEINLWTDCVKKSPNKARPFVNLGLAYFESGQYDKAIDLTQKAIQIDPKSAHAYHTLSLTLQKVGDLNKAIEMGKKALEIDPTFNMAHYSLGAIYFENGQYEESAVAYRRFIKVFPYFPEVHHLLAIVYAAQKQFDKAIAEFEWEIRINPYHTLAHLNLGQLYWYEFQNREKAIYHLKVALMLDPFLPNRAEIRRLMRLLEGLS